MMKGILIRHVMILGLGLLCFGVAAWEARGQDEARVEALWRAQAAEAFVPLGSRAVLQEEVPTVYARQHQSGLPWVLFGGGMVMTGLVLLGQRSLHRKALALEAKSRQLEEANERLAALSLTDGLTGVSNRRSFDRALEREWRRAWRDRRSVALIVLDLDHFKSLNDTLGHPQGDESLKQVARLMARQASRPGDLCARLGGEEFALLLAGADDKAGQIAERCRLLVEQLGLPHPASSVSSVVTASLGWTSAVPQPGQEAHDLLTVADLALYDAKRGGRNRVCWRAFSALPGASPVVLGGLSQGGARMSGELWPASDPGPDSLSDLEPLSSPNTMDVPAPQSYDGDERPHEDQEPIKRR
jgi:diguanylate cyclase (GGDEF)-like protein